MDVFRQARTHGRVRRLAVSQLACLGRHTVTGLLCAGGRQQQDWSADYRVFSRSPWSGEALFDSVLGGVTGMLAAGEPLVTGMDDTLLRKSGGKIPGAGYRRDPLSPPFHTNLVRGQRFLQVSAMLPQGPAPSGARAIPIRFDPAPSVPKPSRKATEEVRTQYRQQCRRQNLSTAGVHAVARTRRKLDEQPGGRERLLIVGVDGSYTNQTVLRGLPPHTTLIGRIRKDAKLFQLPPAADGPPPRGRRRQYGPPAPTPDALRADESVPWQELAAWAAGKVHRFRIKTLAAVLWPMAGPVRPLRLVVIAPVGYRLAKGSKLLYRQPAYLICTDPDLPLERLLQSYLWRWQIEVNHRDEKQLIGVGEAQVRSPLSAQRDPAFAAACYAKLLLAAAQTYGPGATQTDVPLPKWRSRHPANRLTTGDLLTLLRQELWAAGLQWAEHHCGRLPSDAKPDAKCPQIRLSLAGAVQHAATG